MTEAMLKSALMRYLRKKHPSAVILRHEDRITAGIPDVSVTWDGSTSWWEVKYAKSRIRTRGIQELTCLRLARQGLCYYLIYEERDAFHKRTRIVTPVELQQGLDGELHDGFDHAFVAQFISRLHHDRRK